jgi:hypothetical protein
VPPPVAREREGDIANSDEETTVKLIQDSVNLLHIRSDFESDTIVERKFIQRSAMRHQQKAPIEFFPKFSLEGPLLLLNRKGVFRVRKPFGLGPSLSELACPTA